MPVRVRDALVRRRREVDRDLVARERGGAPQQILRERSLVGRWAKAARERAIERRRRKRAGVAKRLLRAARELVHQRAAGGRGQRARRGDRGEVGRLIPVDDRDVRDDAAGVLDRVRLAEQWMRHLFAHHRDPGDLDSTRHKAICGMFRPSYEARDRAGDPGRGAPCRRVTKCCRSLGESGLAGGGRAWRRSHTKYTDSQYEAAGAAIADRAAAWSAVIVAANRFGSFFTGQFTAAGKVAPAKVLIIGAGVAGLAALGAAKGLGAIVRSFDVRAAAEEQVKSLGGEFLTVTIKESGEGQGGYAKEMSKEFLDAEYALFRAQAKEVDIVITTALIPGRPAPKLWFKDMVELMKPGSVVVDLAAEQGGNCEYTVPGEAVVQHGVTIVGFTDLPSRMASDTSDLNGMNLLHFLDEMGGASGWKIDHDNDAGRPALVLENGDKKWPAPPMAKKEPSPAAKPVEAAKPLPSESTTPPAKLHGHGGPVLKPASKSQGVILSLIGLALAVIWLYQRVDRPTAGVSGSSVDLFQHLTVFVMAVIVGWQVVWSVTPALHTPLMSVTNAISGNIVVGGCMGGTGQLTTSAIVAIVATAFATINICGGFLVTRRLLAMVRK